MPKVPSLETFSAAVEAILIGGELRVLLAIAPGLGLREAAILGIRETTAKTHLQRIFAKTGTSRQTELLHLLKNTASPLQRQ